MANRNHGAIRYYPNQIFQRKTQNNHNHDAYNFKVAYNPNKNIFYAQPVSGIVFQAGSIEELTDIILGNEEWKYKVKEFIAGEVKGNNKKSIKGTKPATTYKTELEGMTERFLKEYENKISEMKRTLEENKKRNNQDIIEKARKEGRVLSRSSLSHGLL